MSHTTSETRTRVQLWIVGSILLVAGIAFLIFAGLSFELTYTSLIPESGDRSLVSLDSQTGAFAVGYSTDEVSVYERTGDLRWSAALANSPLAISIVGESVFVTDESRNALVLDSESGEVRSAYDVPFRPIAVSGEGSTGRVLVASTLTAFRNELRLFGDDGETLFAVDPDDVVFRVFYHAETETSSLLTQSGRVVQYSPDGQLQQVFSLGDYPSAIAGSSSFLVVSDDVRQVFLLDVETLDVIWSTQVEFPVRTVQFADDRGAVIASSADGRIAIIDSSGAIGWSVDVGRNIRNAWGGTEDHDLFMATESGSLLVSRSEHVQRFSTRNQHRSLARIAGIILTLSGLLVGLSLLIASRVRKDQSSIFRRIYLHRQSYLLLLPTVGLLLVFNYYPAVSSMFIAFADYLPGSHFQWVGFSNFQALFANEYFWVGARNMFAFLVTDLFKFLVPPIIAAELIFALRNSGLKYWIRVLFYLPAVLPGVAGLLVWTEGMLGVDGAVNGLLELVGLGRLAQPWLANPDTALPALIFMGFPWVGTFYIIFFGALISIPDSLFDAAKIDGCGWIRRIIVIDLPHISPQIKFVLVVGFIASVQDFQRVFVTTMGGPGHATYTPMLELYFQMTRFHNYGVAAAMGVVLFVVLFAGTVFNLRLRLVQK